MHQLIKASSEHRVIAKNLSDPQIHLSTKSHRSHSHLTTFDLRVIGPQSYRTQSHLTTVNSPQSTYSDHIVIRPQSYRITESSDHRFILPHSHLIRVICPTESSIPRDLYVFFLVFV